jgi:hypothetical protein
MPPRTRYNDILAIYHKYNGDIGLDRLTHYCWDEGVWTGQEQRNMAFAAAKRECHQALRTKGPTGLPIAGPTQKRDNGSRRWRQISLWDYDDATYNLGMRITQAIDRDWPAVIALHNYIQERYGQAPPIPHWEMDGDAPLWWRDLNVDSEDDDA